MPVTFVAGPLADALPIHFCRPDEPVPQDARAWAEANGFAAEAGRVLVYPGPSGRPAGALLGVGKDIGGHAPLLSGALAKALPAGNWRLEGGLSDRRLAALGLALGAYVFGRYGKKPGRDLTIVLPEGLDFGRLEAEISAHTLVRDLVNTPTNDMGPGALEEAAAELAGANAAALTVTRGEALLSAGFPMIHAVGRAGAEAPRLIDMTWGSAAAPKITLVGKGVCFDTGGLDIKPSSGMLLMKKDMGGAANVLGLAAMIMRAALPVRLRVLIPAVENSISANSYRPGDVLRSRKGLTVEIGNTDAEGRLVLADALAFADEEAPDLLVDMATLTGAARVALGPDLPPFYTDDDRLAADLAKASVTEADPLWRMPLWPAYDGKFSSKIADVNNVNSDGFAGSVIAALFLKRFVDKAKSWAHFDIFAWNPVDRPHGPVGGEAQAIRAIARVLDERYRR